HFARARSLLSRYGIRFCRDGLANSVDAAIAVADGLGYPVVLKTGRPDVMHKTENGAVVTHLRTRDDVRAAAQRLVARGHAELLVQEQVPGFVELLVGGRQDPTFGAIVVVGLGGFLAEAVRDVSTALAPLSIDEARALVGEGVRARLFGGYRGLP